MNFHVSECASVPGKSAGLNLYSFDIFDTCLVRDVIAPSDLFCSCAKRMRDEGLIEMEDIVYRDARIRAESEARLALPEREATIGEIHAKLSKDLSWNAETSRRALTIELEEEERSLAAVPSMAEKIEACRADGRVVFISDMYLPSSFLKGVLSREGLLKGEEKVYVSGELRCSKSDGALYDHVRKECGDVREWRHFGDNDWADRQQAERKGIIPSPETDCNPSRHEAIVRTGERPADVEWKWSAAAGRMRSARLHGRLLPLREQKLWAIGAGVTGPLLTSFVVWCLREAGKRGIERLYFISRDGQVLHKIARIVAPALNSSIECRYLYGSRQAWHAASMVELSERERNWIFNSDKELRLSDVLRRLGLNPEGVQKFLALPGLDMTSIEDPLDRDAQERIWAAMAEERATRFLLDHAKDLREQVLDYLDQELFFDGKPFAIVDVGWHGALQGSLMRMLIAAGKESRLTGFYFGLFPNHQRSENQELVGFWNSIRGGGFPGDRAFMAEIMMAADHGSVMGYAKNNGQMAPVLNRPRNEEALAWGLNVHMEAILKFAEEACRDGLLGQLEVDEFGRRSLLLFESLCEAPSKDEAEILGSFPHAMDQTERTFRTMIHRMSGAEVSMALLRQKSRPPAWWIEGQAAATPSPVLRAWMILKKLKKRFF